MQKSFKDQKDGSFELLLDDQNSGIFFHIPPKCKIEDYNIVIVGQKLVSSSRAHFTLNNRPENMGRIKINSAADIHFDNNINIKVGKQLEIGKNNNLVINSYSKTSLYIDGRTKIIGQGSAAFLTATSKNFNIIRNSTTTIEGFNFINVGEGTINFSDTNVFSNSTICTYDKRANLNLSGARLSGSAINFTQSDDHVYKIKTLIANQSNIDNAAGTFSGTIENAKVDYLTFNPSSSLYLNMRDRDYKDSSLTLAQSEDNRYSIKRAYLVNSEAKNISGDIYLYAENSKISGMTFEDNSGVVLTTNAPHDKGISNFVVENILLKKDSSLEAKDTKGKDASIKLGNIVVEGEATLASNSDYIMESSILGKGTTSLTSGSEELKILNSILQGNNTIGKVTSITNSKIENSIIIAANAKIEDTELVNVANYKAYIQPKVEDISIITNEIEKL